MKKYFTLSLFIILIQACSRVHNPESRFAQLLPKHTRSNHEAMASKVMVTSQGQASSMAGLKMFQEGGNIIDAAVATSFAISVERPHSTGIGGGGFLLFYDKKNNQTHVFDFREMAPIKSHPKMYLDSKGEVIENLSLDGGLSVGVPGLVAGLYEIHQKFGKLPWSKVLEPSIELARDGFPMYSYLVDAIKDREEVLRLDPSMLKTFFDSKGEILKVSDLVKQPELAHTLTLIAQNGQRAFYSGDIAKQIVDSVKARGGILNLKDLKNYQVKKRQAVVGDYKGYKIISMPPPSSGGSHVIEILNLLENIKLDQAHPRSADSIHKIATAMQIAFSDRAKYMGDPDFNQVPTQMLTSKEYALKFKSLFTSKAIPSAHLGQEKSWIEPNSTTHFSVADQEGNMVVSTQTINGYFGSGMMAQGTGIILNNEMDDFAAKVGASNLFGAIGGEKNLVEPRKRPLSSMSPTIVLKNGNPFLALGTPSGTRIINCVAQTILNVVEFNLPLYEAVALARIHHQWYPEQIQIEAPFVSSYVVKELEKMGHKVVNARIGCQIQAVMKTDGGWLGVADPRGEGLAIGL